MAISTVFLVQLELALHDADCLGHSANFEGHGDKYTKLALAAVALFPPEREPWWLRDMKMINESGLEVIHAKLRHLEDRIISIQQRTGS